MQDSLKDLWAPAVASSRVARAEETKKFQRQLVRVPSSSFIACTVKPKG